MAGLRGLEGDRDRLHVAHLAYQDHLGGLAEGGPEGEGEGLGVGAHLALVDGRLVVGVQVLDGVFDGDDVDVRLLVHLVDEGGQGSGLARAGGARHQHDPVALGGDLPEVRGQSQLPDGGDLVGDHPENDRVAAPLAEHVHPEAGAAGQAVGEVGGARADQAVGLVALVGEQPHGDQLGLVGQQALDAREGDRP